MGAPIRDKTRTGTLVSLIPGGAAVLAYILRVIARMPFFGGNWGLDDWVITAAIVRYTANSYPFYVRPLTYCRY
jgi:hypothetical protein